MVDLQKKKKKEKNEEEKRKKEVGLNDRGLIRLANVAEGVMNWPGRC